MGSSGRILTTTDILNGTILAADIANDTITAAQLAADSVGASELADSSVDTANILANAVSQVGVFTQASNKTTTSTAAVVVPDNVGTGEMAVTLTTTGGPLLMGFTATLSNGAAGGVNALGFLVDGTPTGDLMAFTAGAVGDYGCHTITHLAMGIPAGSRTVKALWRVNSGTASIFGRELWVLELKR